jgi:ribosomal protein L12E/L44/L45/RPP1/RPP2
MSAVCLLTWVVCNVVVQEGNLGAVAAAAGVDVDDVRAR